MFVASILLCTCAREIFKYACSPLDICGWEVAHLNRHEDHLPIWLAQSLEQGLLLHKLLSLHCLVGHFCRHLRLLRWESAEVLVGSNCLLLHTYHARVQHTGLLERSFHQVTTELKLWLRLGLRLRCLSKVRVVLWHLYLNVRFIRTTCTCCQLGSGSRLSHWNHFAYAWHFKGFLLKIRVNTVQVVLDFTLFAFNLVVEAFKLLVKTS